MTSGPDRVKLAGRLVVICGDQKSAGACRRPDFENWDCWNQGCWYQHVGAALQHQENITNLLIWFLTKTLPAIRELARLHHTANHVSKTINCLYADGTWEALSVTIVSAFQAVATVKGCLQRQHWLVLQTIIEEATKISQEIGRNPPGIALFDALEQLAQDSKIEIKPAAIRNKITTPDVG